MTRFNLYKLSSQEQRELLDRFFMAAAFLSSFDEVKKFFKDLLSPQETAMLARRLKAAEMLADGETYDEIGRRLSMGADTVARVHRWLNSGSGGYGIAIKQLKKLDKRQSRKDIKKIKALEGGWEHFKKIYPTVDFDNIDELKEAIEDYARKRKRKKSLRKKSLKK